MFARLFSQHVVPFTSRSDSDAKALPGQCVARRTVIGHAAEIVSDSESYSSAVAPLLSPAAAAGM